jgi:hypothetical protein
MKYGPDWYDRRNWWQIIRRPTSGVGLYIFRSRFLFEHHEADCTCSYCMDWDTVDMRRCHLGLNVNWAAWRDCWWVIRFPGNRYIRIGG